MQEELITSGRDLHNIDPTLQVWHWPISIDLFFGGLAAGLLFFAALFYLLGKQDQMSATVKYAPIVAPIAITIALLCLFYDLTNKIYFWRLYTTFRIESPMSFGSWVLLLITPISFLWVFSYLREIFPKLQFKFSLLNKLEAFTISKRKLMAILLIPLSISLGMYTGILLAAFNARPLWNNAILGPLFLVSGLTTAAAVVIYFSRKREERRLFYKIALGLIVIQLFLMTHMILGYYAGSEVQLEALQLLVGGEFTLVFFGIVLLLGLIIPAMFMLPGIYGRKIPVFLVVLFMLIGGLAFRFVMVDAGQLTRYLY